MTGSDESDPTGESLQAARETLSPAFASGYGRAVEIGTDAAGKDTKFDRVRAAIVVAAREELTQHALGEWAESMDVASRHEVSYRKQRLEAHGFVESTWDSETTGNGGPTKRLSLTGDSRRAVETEGFRALIEAAAVDPPR
jgi:hypothetical protein